MNDETRSAADEIPQGQEPLGWWESLNTTPLRDALRGEWSCRLSYRRVLRESSLPAPMVAVIEKIICRARLWQREGTDVARELIAHFQEGLDRGVSEETLIDRFGSIKTTARLIRRARLRKRPIWWKTWYGVSRSFVATVAVLVVLYLVQAFRLLTSYSVIDTNYLAELNAPIHAIPEKDRAWPRYVDAMRDFPKWPNKFFDEEVWIVSPKHYMWPEINAIVNQNRDRIKTLQEIAEMPELGLILGDSDDPAIQLHEKERERFGIDNSTSYMWEVSNPCLHYISLQDMTILKCASNLLSFAAIQSATEGDSKEFVKNVNALIRLGKQVLGGQSLISMQVDGLIFYARGCTCILYAVAEFPDLLTQSDIRDLFQQIKSDRGRQITRIRTDVERLMCLDIIRRTYTSGPTGHLSMEGWDLIPMRFLKDEPQGYDYLPIDVEDLLDRPIAMTIAVSRADAEKQILDIYRRADDYENVTPIWDRDVHFVDQLMKPLQSSFAGYARNPSGKFADYFMLSDRVGDWEIGFTTHLDVTMVVLAITLFKAEHKRWPIELDELVPDYLKSIPLDPNDGQPLRYRLTQDGPLLYAIGADRHDDGGRSVHRQLDDFWPISYWVVSKKDALKIHNDPDNPQNGDWILWPPVEKKEAAKPAATKVE